MKKMRFLRDAKGKKVGVILPMAEFERLTEASEEWTACARTTRRRPLAEDPFPTSRCCEGLNFRESERFKPARRRIEERE
jgi:hypothetical protein